MGNDGECSHLIVTADECLEVICRASPIVKEIGKSEAVVT
ncbi:hypothetical protein N481_23245 [Pseudoalteromonas luteoviolacea S4047-1]|uniref:Uncharacterized protein n=1 Tax=Pseudoalteromonas luteoviolacea S4054 TaxID=1129367 RepID=A0A0F6AHJ6_9GAMM|nr:hypothetical protein N479_25525 [Pseudoalteromonas luteoviolacea S4054]KZN68169.1 hypothetical protein N481_23245 [Pseudoalteromonas luteoviolacea S4047-1]